MINNDIKEELIEEWREYNGYKVSNYGKVINKHGKYLKAERGTDDYIHTSIQDYGGGEIRGMHRIVATVFLPNPNNLPETNHKDGVRYNNKVNNLEWCTKKENMQHRSDVLGCMVGTDNPTNKLTEEQVLEIYALCRDTDLRYKDIAEMYNIVPSQVSLIANGTKWKNLGLEPLPRIVRGSRRNGKKGVHIVKSC